MNVTRCAAIVCVLSTCLRGNELYVPSEKYVVIQDAIDDAVDGDTVIVGDGEWSGFFNVNLDLLGKAITVRSENGPENCVIRGTGNEQGFRGDMTNATIMGFTITQCSIGIDANGGKITNCYMSSNGTGMRLSGKTMVQNCTIDHNTNRGVITVGGAPVFRNCLITRNSAFSGGGMRLTGSPILYNCTVTFNDAIASGGGIHTLFSQSDSIMRNLIVWGNTPDNIVVAPGSGPPRVRYSNIEGGYNGLGNIDIDPLLGEDGQLAPDSPCIDAGNPNFVPLIGERDLDGNRRVLHGRVDMGAYEFAKWADTNDDFMVDLQDYETFASCPLGAVEKGCESVDLDNDGELTLLDFGEFQAFFGNQY